MTFPSGVRGTARSTIAITKGEDSFYYFEAHRSQTTDVFVGISGLAPDTAPTDPAFDTSSAVTNFQNFTSRAAGGGSNNRSIGSELDLGFAVDFRAKYPAVYVIGHASGQGVCAGLSSGEPCVLGRIQLQGAPNQLRFYAFSSGGGNQTSISVNTGADLSTKPFAYSQAGVRKALRTAFYQGDRGFNAQWPTSTGAAAVPTLTRGSGDWTVVRQGGTDTANFVALACPVGAQVSWTDETGAARGTGATLVLSAATVNGGFVPGEHTLLAAVTDATTGRYAELKYRFTVDASGTNADDDGDGLAYDSEKAAGTNPGNPDTDGDGLSDGVETSFAPAFTFSPIAADTDQNGVNDGRQLAGNSALSEHLTLTKSGATATSSGIVLSDDGFSAAFTNDLNQDCVQRIGAPFDGDPYQNGEICKKRAVRTSGGIGPGEFRYFETRRLAGPGLDAGGLDNLGHGVITRTGQIDPYCCFVGPLHQDTPPSMSLNSTGGLFVRLENVGSGPFNYNQTVYYGFAVDYRGSDPVVYVIGTSGGTSVVSQALPLAGFANTDVMPMLYGHPLSDSEARGTINLGLQAFHYNARTLLQSAGVSTTGFKPGVGIHERP